MGKTRETGYLRNILAYDASGLTGYVPNSRTLTINGTTLDLSSNRTFNIATSATLGGLTDATISALVDNQILKYNAATSKWVNWTPNYLTGITSSQVTTALGYTPVTTARTITINGTAYDLSADRAWTITASTPTQMVSPNGGSVIAGDSALPSAANSFIHTLALGPGGNDGHILAMSWTNTGTYGAQIWLDTDPTNRMAIRSRSGAGAWNGWWEVLTEGNYSSYAYPKSGGTVNGYIQNGSVWINNGGDYNSYNENIRLFNAPNGVSVIAFSASGTSGMPTTSILGYSDRMEFRYNNGAQFRVYDGYAAAMGSFRAPIFRFTNSTNNAYLTGNSDWGFRAVNDHGYIQFGPANGGWAHIYSNLNFYFNQNLYVNGTQVVTNSGTWSINVSGNAATATNVYNINYALGNEHYWTAIQYFQTNNHGYSGSTNSAKLQAYSTGNNSAFMSFHKSGVYAVNMGLDADNVFRIGGWSASANRLQMDMSGNLTMAGDVTAYSDIRVKTNIKTVENALEKVLALRGVYYNRTDSSDTRRKLGVIAQETMQIVPEVVSQDNSGMYNVSYGNLGGLFIEAFKDQQKRIEAQDKEIKELKDFINGLTR